MLRLAVSRWPVACALILVGCQFALGIESVVEQGSGGVMRKQITLSPAFVQGDVNDFPVAVIVRDDPDLAAAGLTSDRQIQFTDEDGRVLDHEVEEFDPDAGSVIAWVRVPTLFAGLDTEVFLYYGHEIESSSVPGDTWSEQIAGVWHMGEESARNNRIRYPDSTQASTHGFSQDDNTRPRSVDGLVGSALSFDGMNDNVTQGEAGGDPRLSPLLQSFSCSLWVHTSETLNAYDVAWYNGGYTRLEPGFDIELGTGAWKGLIADGFVQFTAEFGRDAALLDQWVHLTMVVDRENHRLLAYTNGDLAPTIENDIDISGLGSLVPDSQAMLGKDHQNRERFSGMIDEVRLYKVALSPDWIAAEYHNLMFPGSFLTVHAAEPAARPD